MGTRKFMVVVDTTYSPVPTQFPQAIIDVQIIVATDEQHARQLFLRSIPENLANQLQHNLYIFDLETMFHDMDTVEEKGGTPVFKFVLPGNRRPPKSTSIEQRVSANLGNQTVTQPNDSRDVDQRNPQPAPQAEPPAGNEVITQANKSVRSSEFQQKEYESRSAPEVLNEQQADIISRMGAGQRMEGADEAVNGQVNTSTGMNASLRVQSPEQVIGDDVNPEQAKILASLGADQGTQIVQDAELQAEIAEVNPAMIDNSLAEVPTETPLSDEQIAALESDDGLGE